jgi:aminoglycoside/choline kinase family phosphotransferase/choline kinase
MRALILAAGLGTRLRPHTRHTPKPLFTIDGRPLLDRIIRDLIRAGAEALLVNTHHLPECIAEFIRRQAYPVPVTTRHEPVILGTGGAIRNAADFWDRRPFMVVNSDICTDIDFREVYAAHARRRADGTLVLWDDPAVNSVALDAAGRVVGFGNVSEGAAVARRLTFTGIQVLEPRVLDFIAPTGFDSSIDAFARLLAAGGTLNAWVSAQGHWSDLGTPERYREAARQAVAAEAFRAAFPEARQNAIHWKALAGDGSDRRWYRLSCGPFHLVAADHGIRPSPAVSEADAFVALGAHLQRCGVPVPRIFRHDTFAGLVVEEDLGDLSFQAHLAGCTPAARRRSYRQVMELLVHMSARGAEGFDPAWTWQTPRYDREVILERECRYFQRAFLEVCAPDLAAGEDLELGFEHLAAGIPGAAAEGFLHRDFQSRNIMVDGGRFVIIDFQGGRLGPLPYDLASLLIDPYVDLPLGEREALLTDFLERYCPARGVRRATERLYRLCALARNLQILGAFGFLSRQKGKRHFETYIPAAVRSLAANLVHLPPGPYGGLRRVAAELARRWA